MICFNIFYVVRKEISVVFDLRHRATLNIPIVKFVHFGNVMSKDMTLPK